MCPILNLQVCKSIIFCSEHIDLLKKCLHDYILLCSYVPAPAVVFFTRFLGMLLLLFFPSLAEHE